jgi:hypothetical protein
MTEILAAGDHLGAGHGQGLSPERADADLRTLALQGSQQRGAVAVAAGLAAGEEDMRSGSGRLDHGS